MNEKHFDKVVIDILGGVVSVRKLPANIVVEINDYDVDSHPLQDVEFFDENGCKVVRDTVILCTEPVEQITYLRCPDCKSALTYDNGRFKCGYCSKKVN